jgi:hypothetical protein
VFELIFLRDSPVLLHDRRTYYAQKPTEPPELYVGSPEDDEEVADDEHSEGSTESDEQMAYDERYKSCIYVHPKEAYRRRCVGYQDSLTKWQDVLEAEEYQLQPFDHGFTDGFGLLGSCRQLYHEAADILYGNNAFIFSRTPSRHNVSHMQDSEDDCVYHQMRYASTWLRSVGTQRQLLKNVAIDLSTICAFSAECEPKLLEILPILKLI